MIQIDKKENCTGCSACAMICPKACITMQSDEEGFRYPQVNEKECIHCELCVKTCPELNHVQRPEPIKIVGLKNRNGKMAMESASAGVSAALCDFIVQHNGVVAGAVYNEDFSVSHVILSDAKELPRLNSSKYQQSNINHIYKDIRSLLKQEKTVLFIGTPCQVAGLKHFLQKDYPNLYTCDLICHGVPSPKVFQSYLHFIEKKYKRKTASINMRDKTLGWNTPGIRIQFTDEYSIFRNKETNLFNGIYSVHYATRPSCHACLYANMKREGDLTIGDFWGIEKRHPDFFDKHGVSLVLINTEKGEKLLNEILPQFEWIISNKDECMQPNLAFPAPQSPVHEKFFQDFNKYDFETIAKKYLDYGKLNLYKQYARKILRKLHLGCPAYFRSTIIKNKIS